MAVMTAAVMCYCSMLSASATTATDSAADVDVAVAAVASDDVHCCFGRLCCVLCLLWCCFMVCERARLGPLRR